MTNAEARTFLTVNRSTFNSAEINLVDAYEQQLFDFKQFFRSKVILRSTFLAKLAKLQHLQNACDTLGIVTANSTFLPIDLPVFDEVISHVFAAYQHVKLSSYQQLYASTSPHDIQQIVHNLLAVSHQFNGCWIPISLEENPILLSKEMDTMELLAQINQAEDAGIFTFKQLAQATNKNIQTLQLEATRFYLLHQKEEAWIQSSKN